MPDSNSTEPYIAVLPERSEEYRDPSTRITRPQPVANAQVPSANTPERVIDRLSKAAQRIAEEEQSESILHKRSRASRLAPIRDISADIRRESTPSIRTWEVKNGGTQFIAPLDLVPASEDFVIDEDIPVSGQFPTVANPPEILPIGADVSSPPSMYRPESAQEFDQDLGQRMPDLWPWFLEADSEENETDTWANRTDPLTLRHFPSSNEAARIEEEDIRRARAEGVLTAPVPKRRRRRSSRVRSIFIILAVLAVLALIVDGVLLSAALLHPHRTPNNANGPATLTVSQPTASIGSTITARISHFSPSTSVLLTHDIEEPVQTTTGHALVKLDSYGNASVKILIDTSWGAGFHTLQAEDVTTRYTASAQLHIVSAGETRPSHLFVDQNTTSLNMGTDYQDSNTIKVLTLRNSGDGTPISWAASTNQPWLMISPPQGIFSASQTLSVAVDRVNLKPDNYTGLIVISSNVGPPLSIKVQMSVKPLPPNPGPVLAVTPALLSFTATDGGSNPPAQSLTISNPGSLPLHWTVTANTLLTASNANSLFHALGAKANWLSTNLTQERFPRAPRNRCKLPSTAAISCPAPILVCSYSLQMEERTTKRKQLTSRSPCSRTVASRLAPAACPSSPLQVKVIQAIKRSD